MFNTRLPRVLAVAAVVLVLCAVLAGAVGAVSPPLAGLSREVAPSHVAVPSATIVVTSTADSGPGTLRQALLDVPGAGPDTITFDPAVFPPVSPVTIYLQSSLPALTTGYLTIDASDAGVVLDGTQMPSGYYRGLTILSDMNVIYGLQIVNMPWDGILIENGSYNVIGGDRTIGAGPLGQGNLISGNGGHGIQIYQDSSGNQIRGNYVGTDVTGSVAWPNAFSGVALQGAPGPSGTVVGGSTETTRNVVSANGQNGVQLVDGAHYNRVIGNYIGVDASGTQGLGNGWHGIDVTAGLSNTLGGTGSGEGNVVSANLLQGIYIRDKTGLFTFPDVSGLPVAWAGVFPSIDFPDTAGPFAHSDGTTPVPSSGDPFFYDVFAVTFTGTLHIPTEGIYQFWLGSDDGSLLIVDGDTVVDRNYEGGYSTSYGERYLFAGDYAFEVDFFEGYGSAGVGLQVMGPGSASFTTDGSTPGVYAQFYQPPAQVLVSSGNVILGNYIGTDSSGALPLANTYDGIHVEDSDGTMIGGPTDAERNIITHNGSNGVTVEGTLAVSTTIHGNWIGVDADGTGGLDPRDLDVTDDGTVYMADYGRGAVRSTDGAGTWEVITAGLTTADIELIAVAPNFTTTQRVWAWGANELFVSADAGDTWSSLGEVITGVVKALEVSPNYEVDGMLMAGLLWPDYGGMMGGVYRSIDGGASWATASTDSAQALAFSPNFASDQTVLAGGYGLQRSTDGGVTWTRDTSGPLSLSISDLAYAEDGNTVFLVSHHCSNDGVYVSTDGGLTWAGSGTGLGDCGSYWRLALSPDFAASGLALAAEDRMYRSTDSGATWGEANANVFGSRAQAMAFASPQTAYFANFNGVFRTVDGGSTWAWAASGLADRGNHGRGVEIRSGAGATQVISNVIARNAYDGVSLWGTGPEGTLIAGNLIGLGPDGRARAGNGSTGVVANTSYVTVTGNTIGGNGHGGIRSYDESVHHLTITGNRVGTDVTGMVAVGNSYDGISLVSSYDTIGGNLVSGNRGNGILAAENTDAPHDSVIAGNWVGVDATGAQALPNQGDGVRVSGSYMTVGGVSTDDRNVLSGNWGVGLNLSGDDNLVIGNYIGPDVSGTQSVGYGFYGIYVSDQADGNRIGGDQPEERNLVSGNHWQGIYARGSNTTIQGNYIGTDATGAYTVPNGGIGIYLGSYADHNTVGGQNTATDGSCTGECNLVSGNGGGIYAAGTDVVSNTITGNFVGTSADGLAVLGNQNYGVYLSDGAQDTVVGGPTTSPGSCAGACNLIAGSASTGVMVREGSTVRNTVTQNSIYANGGLGIDLWDGGNTELPAPVITSFDVAVGTASGTACADCTVEVFSDQHAEGRWYEGSAVADGAGNWSFAKGAALYGSEVTATATDTAGNTSEFGQDWPADPPPPPVFAYPFCGTTNQPRPVFQGIAQLGSLVRAGTSGTVLGSGVTNDESRWTIFPGSSLNDGEHVITATAETVWGTSGTSALSLTVDSQLCYDPVGIVFEQQGIRQHPRDASGCANTANDLEITLWPSEPVTVSVPVAGNTETAYIEVNSIRYDLLDPDADGVAEATFAAPEGSNFVVLLAVPCGGGLQTLQIGSTIDPDGYVYDAEIAASTGITQPVAGVTVTLYYSDTVRTRWVMWDAGLYGQANPQVTGPDGYFSFFTPPGLYKLVVDGTAVGYGTYESPVLTVVDEPIRNNVPLSVPKYVYLPMVVRD